MACMAMANIKTTQCLASTIRDDKGLVFACPFSSTHSKQYSCRVVDALSLKGKVKSQTITCGLNDHIDQNSCLLGVDLEEG